MAADPRQAFGPFQGDWVKPWVSGYVIIGPLRDDPRGNTAEVMLRLYWEMLYRLREGVR